MSFLSSLLTRALNGDGISSPLGTIAPDVLLGDFINALYPTIHTDIADPGNAGAIPVTRSGTCRLVTTGAETRTVAAPADAGMRLALYFQTDGGDCVITFAGDFNAAGNNVLTHDTAGEVVVFESVYIAEDTLAWRLVANPEATPLSG